MNKTNTVLIIDDDIGVLELVSQSLHLEGLKILKASNIAHFMKVLKSNEIDAILMDFYIAGEKGSNLVKTVREITDIPILMLSGSADPKNKIRSIEAGADDYVTKPFNAQELACRIRANIRRVQNTVVSTEQVYELEEMIFHPERRAAQLKGGRSLELTEKEMLLLAALCKGPKRIFSRPDLNTEIGALPDSRSVDVHMTRLRKKLYEAGIENMPIQTVHGAGYMLACDVDESDMR